MKKVYVCKIRIVFISRKIIFKLINIYIYYMRRSRICDSKKLRLRSKRAIKNVN